MIDIPPPYDTLGFRLVIGLVIGLVFGSFITMLSYRLPRKLSIIHPRSQCPSCHATLGVRDLAPVFSWLVAHGRCRHCGAKIGSRYLIIELITAIASMIAFAVVGLQPVLLLVLAGIVAVITLATIEVEHKK